MAIDLHDVKECIRSNIEEIKVAQHVALRLGLPVRTLRKRFRHIEGMPLGRYLRLCKLQHIKFLLLRTHLSCAEIAWQSGLERPQSVARAFKREFGVTMEAWRHQNVRKQIHFQHRVKNDNE
jgi:AraC family transcriptional regulator